MSKLKAKISSQPKGVSGYETSIPRTALAALLVILGIAWIAVYLNFSLDVVNYVEGIGKKPADPFPWMTKLGLKNFLIGFGLICLGLLVSAHRKTPLGRGTGVLVGMLGCFLLGLIWIVVFYMGGGASKIPVMNSLGQWNLAVGVAFMAVGFSFATKWE